MPIAVEPDWRFLRAHPAHAIALGFGAGLVRPAPGTWGTLAAWAAFAILSRWLDDATWWVVIAAAFAIGIWACQRTGRALGVADHGAMVWDEIVAFWSVLVFLPHTLLTQAFAFLLFRLFDIAKPQPIRYFDRRLKNGLGVMWDDAVAAFYTLLIFAAWTRLRGL